jgi:UDP-glucose 4-epimerase
VLSDATVFITGGAGFIGSTLGTRMADHNSVTLYDNFARDALSRSALAAHPNVTVVRGDILDEDALRSAMSGHTHVVHCAAIAGIDTVSVAPVTTMRVNMIGSANVMAAAVSIDSCARAVFFSTSEIFGRWAFGVDEHEEAKIGAVGEPRWTYAVSKLAEEHLAIAYHAEAGLPAVVLRPFNVYGPGQVGEGAIRNFVRAAIHDQPLRIYGTGRQIRAWCYVDDMVRAVLLSLEHADAVGQSFNIGNARAIETTWGLAERIIRLTGSRSTIESIDRSGPDVELRVPATDKASRLLGFEAEVGLDEGLTRTASWMRSEA